MLDGNRNYTASSDEAVTAYMTDPSEMYYVMIQCAEDFNKFYRTN